MIRVLEPLVKEATSIRPDDLRNLLILSGTERELKHLLETIDMFDVDWIAGMSVGLFTLQNSDVKIVGQELDKVMGDDNMEALYNKHMSAERTLFAPYPKKEEEQAAKAPASKKF